jgi:hypothetical protein
MKIKGVYEWKLINKYTGKIEDTGTQENLITDSMAQHFDGEGSFTKSDTYARIVLSTTSTPLPPAEYREYGVAQSAISRDVVSGNLSCSYNDSVGTVTVVNNFDPPVTTKTWNIFGLDFNTRNRLRTFLSFIELTTPVTQTNLQYLYISYTFYWYYSGGLLNAPNNNFIREFLNKSIFGRGYTLAYRKQKSDDWVLITPYRAPVTLDNCGRHCGGIYTIVNGSGINDGCRYGQTPQNTFSATTFTGAIGVPVYRAQVGGEYTILGVFNSSDIVPSISRVYVHPESRNTQIFSDPAYPPVSRASINLSGTPTNVVPIIYRVQITKTGDASDIVDETFTTDYATSDQLTVSQDEWAVDDIVQVSSTGTLPSPLAASTNYYIVSKTGSDPTVLIELSLSEGGSAIELTDDGSGIHTISRQITGEYKLTMTPLLNRVGSSNTVQYSFFYSHIYPMEDVNGDLLPNDVSGGDTTPYDYAMIGRNGDYLYTVHYDASGTQLMICRQLFFSPEGSIPLHGLFGTSGVTLWAADVGQGTYANKVYIGTSDGIYEYDFSSPATPTLMPITGMLDTEVRDLSFDSVTEYLWAGHNVGMSRVDLSTNTATQYNNGPGEPLEGISTSYLYNRPGGLDAHNGFVFKSAPNTYVGWLLEDGVGYCQWTFHNSHYSRVMGRIRKSNGQIVVRVSAYWLVYSVSGITGPNTGVATLLETYGVSSQVDVYTGNVVPISDTIFFAFTWRGSTSCTPEVYEIGGTYYDYGGQGKESLFRAQVSTLSPLTKLVPIDVSENSMKLYMVISRSMSVAWYNNVPYGWSGSAWVKDNSTSRQIVESSSHSLGHGISIQFNNATGENWNVQFVEGEVFTFLTAPGLIKDNLQEYSIKVRSYYVTVKRVEDWTTTAASTTRIPECPLGASPDVDFRDLDFDPLVTEVYDVTTDTYLTQASSPPGDGEYSIDGLRDGVFEFHANQIGDTVRLSYNYTCYW